MKHDRNFHKSVSFVKHYKNIPLSMDPLLDNSWDYLLLALLRKFYLDLPSSEIIRNTLRVIRPYSIQILHNIIHGQIQNFN